MIGAKNMKRRFGLVTAVLVAGVLALAPGAGAKEKAAEEKAAEAATATIGEPAPSFELKDMEGNTRKLSEDRGAIVVLEWINPDCPFVQRHYREGTMTGLRKKYADRNVRWIAIATGETAANTDRLKEFADAHGIDYPILLDEEGNVARSYAARTTPHMYIIDPKGVLRYMGGIDDDAEGHRDPRRHYTADALEEISSGKTISAPQTKPYGCTIKFK